VHNCAVSARDRRNAVRSWLLGERPDYIVFGDAGVERQAG